jgi:uncharacterized membrane protein
VVAHVSTFAGLVDAAFNQIRQFGGDSVSVSVRLLEVLTAAAPQMRTEAQRKVLVHHVEMIYRQSCQKVQEPSDLADIKDRYRSAITALVV